MSRYISLAEVASTAYIALGLEQAEYNSIFYEWAYQATRAIGLTQVELKTETIVITSGMATPPAGMVRPNNIAIAKSTTGEVNYPFFDSNFWKDVPSNDQVRDNSYVVNFQGDVFVFSSAVTDNAYDRMILEYWGLPVDDAGEPLIPEYYQRAVTAYIEYMYLKRARNRNRQEIPMSEVQIADAKWKELKLDAVVQRNQPSKPEIDAALAMWQTMLPNQSRLQRAKRMNTASIAIALTSVFDYTFSSVFG